MRAEGESDVTSRVPDRVMEWTTVSFTLTNNRLEEGCVELHFFKKILIYLFDLCCGVWDLTGDRTQAPCSGRADPQGSPCEIHS